MTDYRELSDWAKAKVDKKIIEEVELGPHENKSNGFKWNEPEYTLNRVHNGDYCSECWMIYYNCLCGHDN